MLCIIFSAEFSPLFKGPYLSQECHGNLLSPLIELFGSLERSNIVGEDQPHCAKMASSLFVCFLLILLFVAILEP